MKEQDAAVARALDMGTTQATMVIFDARVNPAVQGKVSVQFLVNPRTFTFEEKDGGRRISIDFFAAAFSPEGKLLKHQGSTVEATLSAEQHEQMSKMGLGVPLVITLEPGTYSLRLAVRDNRTGYVGTVEAPLTVK